MLWIHRMCSQSPSNINNCSNAWMFSDLMKFTAVNESLSKQSRNVLFQRKINWINIINLSFISKSIEKTFLLQPSAYFKDQNLLPTYQSAYPKHHSTEPAILNIWDEVLLNAEHNKGTAMVCLDLSTIFSTVNHAILKTVMERYFGLKGTAFLWLSFYLSDRQFSQ